MLSSNVYSTSLLYCIFLSSRYPPFIVRALSKYFFSPIALTVYGPAIFLEFTNIIVPFTGTISELDLL